MTAYIKLLYLTLLYASQHYAVRYARLNGFLS
jgi:hypothetical protein